MEIRPEERADAPGVVALAHDVDPDALYSLAAYLYRIDSSPERARVARWVAVEDGRVVGSASAGLNWSTTTEGAAWAGITVGLAHRRQGLGTHLAELAEAQLGSIGARRVTSMFFENEPGETFARAHRLSLLRTEKLSAVDPGAVDVPLPEIPGFRVVSLAELRDRPREIYELDMTATLDVPTSVPIDGIEFDEWLRTEWEHPDLAFDGSSIALHDETPVALGLLKVDREHGTADNNFTATARDFRGRGLATLVKLRSLRWAAENGIERVTTSNDETNAPMLAVNHRLGYRPFGARVEYALDYFPEIAASTCEVTHTGVVTYLAE